MLKRVGSTTDTEVSPNPGQFYGSGYRRALEAYRQPTIPSDRSQRVAPYSRDEWQTSSPRAASIDVHDLGPRHAVRRSHAPVASYASTVATLPAESPIAERAVATLRYTKAKRAVAELTADVEKDKSGLKWSAPAVILAASVITAAMIMVPGFGPVLAILAGCYGLFKLAESVGHAVQLYRHSRDLKAATAELDDATEDCKQAKLDMEEAAAKRQARRDARLRQL